MRYLPTLMSRGYGRVQRALLEAIETPEAMAPDSLGLPGRQGVSLHEVCRRLYDTTQPTKAQMEAARRAAHRLQHAGVLEIVHGSVVRVPPRRRARAT
jgi:hypothetical protein